MFMFFEIVALLLCLYIGVKGFLSRDEDLWRMSELE